VSSDVGIRAGADRAVATTVTPATAVLLEDRCVHGRVLWCIDGQYWHVRSVTRGHPFLVPCDTQLKLEAAT
jgi:hypothetical protein